MNVIKTNIDGVLIIEPRLFRDARGYFFESFSEREFKEKVEPLVGYKVEFCQDNESMSSYGVMRGLHFQRPPFTQSKLVRCVKGRVLDVAVDIRKGSPTYGKHVAVELTEDNHRQFFIPTIKEGSTFLTKPLFPQGREDVTALRSSEPLRYKVGGASKPCAMVLRDGTAWELKFIQYLSILNIFFGGRG